MRRTLFLRRAFPPTRPLLNASRAPPPRATPAPTPAAPSRPSLRTTPSGPRPTPVTLNTSPPPSRSTSASHEGDLPQGPIVRRFRTPEQGEKFYRRVRRAAAATHDRDAQMEGLLTYRQDRTIVAIQWVCVVGLIAYYVLFSDWGEEEHVFSPARRYFAFFKNQWFGLSSEETEFVEEMREKKPYTRRGMSIEDAPARPT